MTGRRTVREVLVQTLTRDGHGLSVDQAETLIANMLHQECPRFNDAGVRRAVQMLFVELLDEAIPAGELARIVKSVRQSLLFTDAGFEFRVAEGAELLATLAQQLADELLRVDARIPTEGENDEDADETEG